MPCPPPWGWRDENKFSGGRVRLRRTCANHGQYALAVGDGALAVTAAHTFLVFHLQAIGMQNKNPSFTDPAAVASYAIDTPRKVPGLADLHRMAMLLLAEQAPAAAHVLVVGAGGGLELVSLATAQPGWRFTGVDPSPAMLGLARQAVAPFAQRVQLLTGLIDQAPAGPFDGATCLLTLHFLDRGERLRTLREIHRRMQPGARLVVAHHAPPKANAEHWMARSVAFGADANSVAVNTAAAGKLMSKRLPLLSPRNEEELLRDAGFVSVELFYAAFSFRGWVGTKG